MNKCFFVRDYLSIKLKILDMMSLAKIPNFISHKDTNFQDKNMQQNIFHILIINTYWGA